MRVAYRNAFAKTRVGRGRHVSRDFPVDISPTTSGGHRGRMYRGNFLGCGRFRGLTVDPSPSLECVWLLERCGRRFWNTTYRAVNTTLALILISFSRSVVSDECITSPTAILSNSRARRLTPPARYTRGLLSGAFPDCVKSNPVASCGSLQVQIVRAVRSRVATARAA